MQIQNGLRVERRCCEEDHASNKNQDWKRRELAKVFEEVPWEQRISGYCEVVYERAEENDETENQRCKSSATLPRVGIASRIEPGWLGNVPQTTGCSAEGCYIPEEKHRKPGDEQRGSREVKLCELLPSRLTIQSRMRWRIVKDGGADE